ncbi:MAG: ribosome small subunit-dependent GTPase A, partial [Treponema sp.]|nr:ribosome small subunit-dependent GTPase A [Treponema sp.]
MQGLVLDGTNNVFSVECEDGKVRSCSIKGKVLKSEKQFYNPLCPGDKVVLLLDSLSSSSAQIVSLVERKNAFVRWNIKRRAPQLLAANIDYIVLVTTPAEPPFRPRFIDRSLSQVELYELEPIIVCNKCDLPFSEEFSRYTKIWQELGYTVLFVSAKTGSGMENLASLLQNKTSALVGQSGVGKSSIINSLDKSQGLKTGDLCLKYDRGAHTTTKGALKHLLLANGCEASVIDTPGIRRFIIHDIESSDLAFYFREFAP